MTSFCCSSFILEPIFSYIQHHILSVLWPAVKDVLLFFLPPDCVFISYTLSPMPPYLCAGGDAVVQSPRGAAQLCLHVLSGHVERRLHLRWAPPVEVRRVWAWLAAGDMWPCRVSFNLSHLFSHRPLFQGYTEVQQLQKIFEWVFSFYLYIFTHIDIMGLCLLKSGRDCPVTVLLSLSSVLLNSEAARQRWKVITLSL